VGPAANKRVAFKRHLRAATVPAEAVYLVSERNVTVLSGMSIERIAPLLDGTRTVEQLTRELSSGMPADEVGQLLEQLAEAGLIDFLARSPGQESDEAAAAYWSAAGLDPDEVASSLAGATVEIISTGGVDTAEAAEACSASGLSVHEPGTGAADVSLVLCGDYLDPELSAVNAAHLASGRPWLLAKPSGTESWVGPVFQPGSGPCWACLAKRLAGNRHGQLVVRRILGQAEGGPPVPSLPATQTAGIHAAVLETAKWLAGLRYQGQQSVYILDTLTMRGRHRRVAHRPQCPSCGDPGLVAERASRPLSTTVRDIGGDDGNGQRALGLEEVLREYGHLVDPVTGIVGELRRNPKSPGFLPAYLSGRNRAMTETGITALRAGLRASSGGKGATETEAKVGALCEAVERYCGTLDGDEYRIRDSYRSLGEAAIHPNACQLFDERQFADRAAWNAGCMAFHRVPEPFDEGTVTDWTPVWSLLAGDRKLLPTALLYFHPDVKREPASVQADSNGNAAGTSLEDAILHGFFELVERDAVALWWYNRTRQPAVDLRSFPDPWLAGVPGRYARLNREVWALDVTSDLGIPVMAAISRRTDKPAEDLMVGFGAHFDPCIALRRAVTELGQLLPSVIDARADGTGYGPAEPHLLSWWTDVTTDDQPFLRPDPSETARTARSYSYAPSSQLDLTGICGIARRAKLDILVLDQTRPDVNMPVVKVIVPGLRHFWPRFAPGRLFEVPVRLGRLTEQTAYADLNPIPLYV
jgi:bacteriocin biosynthesis cyclodehydratase domain-containing protein